MPESRTTRVKYKQSIVTFFDILGFGAFVDRTENPNDVANVLFKLSEASTPDPELARFFDLKVVNFSDTVVRATNILSKVNQDRRSGILFHEVLAVVHIQAALATQAVFLRGSITADEIFIGKGLIFGPGLNRAYKLESKVAIYPRIIIDPHVFHLFDETELLKADHHDHATEKSYLRKLLRRDADGLWFVDYLSSMSDEIDEPGDYIAYLGEHRDAIRQLAGGLRKLDDVSVKTSWLATYHNDIVKGLNWDVLGAMGHTMDELLVSAEDIGPLYEM